MCYMQKKSNLAVSRNEEKQKSFEFLSRNMIVTENQSAYGQIVQHVLCTQLNKPNATPHVVSPIRKIPARAATIA